MAKAKQTKTLQIGDVATFVVAIPNCGLKAGEERTMAVTRELLYCIEKGYWKLKK
jgi:hypothetical protein